MRLRPVFGIAALLCAAGGAPAVAAVSDAGETGFTLRDTVTLSVPPAKAYAAMVEVGKWWSSEHTYSGDAANLSLEARANGCWCERLAGTGGVRHMTVVLVIPGKVIHLEGGLGPLQTMGVAASMEWKFEPAEKGTKVAVRYVVGGYNPGGFKELAAGVDAVLHAQIERYQRYAQTGKP
ncbi:MAG: SRPBCC family protein [Acidobacteriota bacterium]